MTDEFVIHVIPTKPNKKLQLNIVVILNLDRRSINKLHLLESGGSIFLLERT